VGFRGPLPDHRVRSPTPSFVAPCVWKADHSLYCLFPPVPPTSSSFFFFFFSGG
jgi:hypothetical protein